MIELNYPGAAPSGLSGQHASPRSQEVLDCDAAMPTFPIRSRFACQRQQGLADTASGRSDVCSVTIGEPVKSNLPERENGGRPVVDDKSEWETDDSISFISSLLFFFPSINLFICLHAYNESSLCVQRRLSLFYENLLMRGRR